MPFLASASLYFLLFHSVMTSYESSFTFRLPARYEECFFQEVKHGSAIEIEYQVIDGGDMDVDFVLRSPSGHVMVSEQRESDGMHEVTAQEDGPVKFCFGNTFSHVTDKTIFIDIGVDRNYDDDWSEQFQDENVDKDFHTVQNVTRTLKQHMESVQRVQEYMRAREARHRHLAELNCERVQFWSIASLIVMGVTATIQTYAVKKLFMDDGKSKA